MNGIGALNLGRGSAEVSSQSARRLVCEGRQTEYVKYLVMCQNGRMRVGPDPNLCNSGDSGINQRVITSWNPRMKLQRMAVMTTRIGVKRCAGGGWG